MENNTKICVKCNQIKPINEYRKSRKCKSCINEERRQYRKNNEKEKAHTREKARERLIVMAQYINELKSHPCEICGQTYLPECMDFDHIDLATKTNEIGNLIWKNNGKKEDLDMELKKCRLLCCYCHATISKEQRVGKTKSKWAQDRLYKINQIKDIPCQICNRKYHLWQMQFDHLNPANKKDAVSNLVLHAKWQIVLEEIAKCQIICVGCHRTITKKRAK
jgi:hypothetical protein